MSKLSRESLSFQCVSFFFEWTEHEYTNMNYNDLVMPKQICLQLQLQENSSWCVQFSAPVCDTANML